MPCRVDICPKCEQYDCGGFNGGTCKYQDKPRRTASKADAFDVEGALCDVLTLLEEKHFATFDDIDAKVRAWWRKHEKEEAERIKEEALKKLSPREKRALGLK